MWYTCACACVSVCMYVCIYIDMGIKQTGRWTKRSRINDIGKPIAGFKPPATTKFNKKTNGTDKF